MLTKYLQFNLIICCFFQTLLTLEAQNLDKEKTFLLQPTRVFDGKEMHENWLVLVKGKTIEAAGLANSFKIPENTEVILLANMTLLPGLIEGHSHLFLHPYNENTWDNQVLRESRAERTARAVVHAEKTLLAGFTTVRDLGTEGAGYDDVGLKEAIEKGIIPGPRMLVATRAIVATGSYGPTGFNAETEVPQGAEEADGIGKLVQTVRSQIGKGADLIKVYADYRWGFGNTAKATFSMEELKLMAETSRNAGCPLVAHATTAEGMRRATLAGAETIEHGDEGTAEIFKLMVEKGVALCPTLAAGDAIMQYLGWKKGTDEEPERIRSKKESFKKALAAGVKICFGGDVGVFTHGDNAREMELMVEYGMKPLDILRSATSVNAEVFHLSDKLGNIRVGLLADLIAVEGNPLENISHIRKIKLVMKDGKIYKRPE